MIPQEIVLGGSQETLLFGRRDAPQCAAEARGSALAHFDEDQAGAVAHDQVELAGLAEEVAFDQDEAVGLQVSQRAFLAELAFELLRGLHWASGIGTPFLYT